MLTPLVWSSATEQKRASMLETQGLLSLPIAQQAHGKTRRARLTASNVNEAGLVTSLEDLRAVTPLLEAIMLLTSA